MIFCGIGAVFSFRAVVVVSAAEIKFDGIGIFNFPSILCFSRFDVERTPKGWSEYRQVVECEARNPC